MARWTRARFHESLNLAALWKLPVVFVCENNQYSMGMAVTKAWSVASLEPRAAAYGMPYTSVDGMDVLAVREAMLEAVERARKGEGPTLVESLTYRFRGHSQADPAYYRTREEEALWRTGKDPITLFETAAERGRRHQRRDHRRRTPRRPTRSSRTRRSSPRRVPIPIPTRSMRM